MILFVFSCSLVLQSWAVLVLIHLKAWILALHPMAVWYKVMRLPYFTFLIFVWKEPSYKSCNVVYWAVKQSPKYELLGKEMPWQTISVPLGTKVCTTFQLHKMTKKTQGLRAGACLHWLPLVRMCSFFIKAQNEIHTFLSIMEKNFPCFLYLRD